MKPTRRGYALIVVVGVALALGASFGARSLNAIVVPALVALLAGGVQLYRAPPPALERSQPEPGFPGESRTVELSVASRVPCRVVDAVGSGLDAEGTAVLTAGDGTHSYEVTLARRGIHKLGPASVQATDAFGLFTRQFSFDVSTSVVVYPTVYRLERGVGPGVDVDAPGRDAFDRLREYVPGDPLRDIHWRTSAKRPPGDLLVAEYTADEDRGVTVAAETPIASAAAADAMASAAASIALALLEDGTAVGLTVPNGTLPERTGRAHRLELFGLLAGVRSGGLSDEQRRRADLVVVADGDGVRVIDGAGDRSFDDLVTEVELAPPA